MSGGDGSHLHRYAHLGSRFARTEITAGDRRHCFRMACDGHRDVIASHHHAGRGIEAFPTGTRHIHFGPGVSGAGARFVCVSKEVFSCHVNDFLNRCAQIMWEHDCGCVPVVDDLSRLVGIITDREVCMGAYTQGRALSEIPVSSVCSREVQSVKPTDTLAHAEDLMAKHQIRRLPVVDEQNSVIGVVSLSDLAQHLKFVALGKSNVLGPRNLSLVFEAVSRRRDHMPLTLSRDSSAVRAQASL